MKTSTRRDFLQQVGAGMLAASIGPSLLRDLGMTPALAGQDPQRLTFGALEPLVALMQGTPAATLQTLLIERYKKGELTPRQMIAASALANARTFGGDDYIGFHSMFALKPALQMSAELPTERELLPVLKAVWRNSNRIQEYGGGTKENLGPVEALALPEGKNAGEAVRDAVRNKDLKTAEGLLTGVCRKSAADGFNTVQTALHDATEVHRVNMVHRAWGLLDIVGQENAHALLRESLHYFVTFESQKHRDFFSGPRTVLPKLVDQYHLYDKPPGTKAADEAWIEKTSAALFAATPADAAEIAAAALAEGMGPAAIHEAIGIGANQLVLRDNNKQAHGATVGVHACDAVNAWKHIGAVSDARNAAAAVVISAYNLAFDRDNPKQNKMREWEPYPRRDAREAVQTTDPEALLRELDDAIRQKDQARATAIVARYGDSGAAAAPVFAIFRRYVLSENGSLHGEKFFGTVTEEFAAARPQYRWRQAVAMARFAASAYGEPSPGYADAVKQLGL